MNSSFLFAEHRISKHLAALSLVVGALLPVAGCGGSETTTGSTASTSSSGAGGSGGASSSAGAGGSGACVSDMVHLDGTLDGTSVAGTFSKGATGGPLAVALNVNFGSGGMIRIKDGVGLVRMPDDGVEPGVWFAAGTGSNAVKGDEHTTFTLKTLKRLGTCAAATGTGDLAFCYDSSGGCAGGDTTATGKVNGTSFDWGGHPNFQFSSASNDTVTVLWKNGAAVFGQLTSGSSAIHNGVVWMPVGPPDSGAFWCAGAGTVGGGAGTKVTLSDMRRLGTAAEGTAVVGEIDGCY